VSKGGEVLLSVLGSGQGKAFQEGNNSLEEDDEELNDFNRKGRHRPSAMFSGQGTRWRGSREHESTSVSMET
jgi:hypothetical protein